MKIKDSLEIHVTVCQNNVTTDWFAAVDEPSQRRPYILNVFFRMAAVQLFVELSGGHPAHSKLKVES